MPKPKFTKTFTVTISTNYELTENDVSKALRDYDPCVKNVVVKKEESVKEEFVTITYGELFNRVYDSLVFAKIGVNEWAFNEGLATRNDKITLSYQQAKHFMSDDEFHHRKG